MKNLAGSSRLMSSGLLALLVAGASTSAVACAKAEPEKKQAAWTCGSEDVPQGEAIRCTSSAATADAPVASSDPATSDGTTPDSTVVYECGPDSTSSDCPPAGTSGGTTTDGTTSEGSPADGTTNDGTSDGTTSGRGGPDECAYVPDLDYCSGAGDDATTSSSSSSSGGTGSGAEGDCTNAKGSCGPPGQGKKGGTTDGTGASSSSGGGAAGGSSSGGASSSGSSGSGGKGKGTHWKCEKDGKGNKSCVSAPDCQSGSHAAACGACISDSDGSDDDCVPPAEGGCWVTGGGYIQAESTTPVAPADGNDNFGGNAKPMKKSGVSGHWNHVDHGTGNHAKGRPEYIMCRVTDGPGPKQPGGKKGLVANQVYFGGHAQWRTAVNATWNDGYWFDVVAEDHGEAGNTHALKGSAMPDSYHMTVRRIDDPATNASGVVVYETRGDLVGGNIQIHPSNNGHPAVSSPLPAWVSIEQ